MDTLTIRKNEFQIILMQFKVISDHLQNIEFAYKLAIFVYHTLSLLYILRSHRNLILDDCLSY